MMMPESLPRIKTFLAGIAHDVYVYLMLTRLVSSFIEHVGRMSASQAASSIRTQAVHRAAIVRFLAKEGWGRDWLILGRVADRVLAFEERQRGMWLFIVDQTLCSQQGDKTENTYSRQSKTSTAPGSTL